MLSLKIIFAKIKNKPTTPDTSLRGRYVNQKKKMIWYDATWTWRWPYLLATSQHNQVFLKL